MILETGLLVLSTLQRLFYRIDLREEVLRAFSIEQPT